MAGQQEGPSSGGIPEGPRSDKPKMESKLRAFREWIQTTTGVISVVVAIIALGGASAAVAINHQSSPGSSPSSPPPSSSVPSTTPPADGSPSGGSPPAPPASSPALVTYIEDLQPTPDSDPYDNRDVAQINGSSYTHSQGAQFCFGSNERKWTYVLGRKYSSFQGTIGLSDNSVSTAKIRFEILADGRPVYSKDLQVGQSAALNVPVSNVLHLELDTTLLTQDGGCGAATGEWANIHAVGP
jgi:hypothetical protein